MRQIHFIAWSESSECVDSPKIEVFQVLPIGGWQYREFRCNLKKIGNAVLDFVAPQFIALVLLILGSLFTQYLPLPSPAIQITEMMLLISMAH